MPDILHRIGFEAPQNQVYEALATKEGLATWWTPDVDGESVVGHTVSFRFGRPEPSAVIEIISLVPTERVEWRCVKGPDEWLDTTVTFDLDSVDDETVLLFTHAGWREPVELMHHCSTAWARFLLGLKAGIEGGKATPWPEGRVSRWG